LRRVRDGDCDDNDNTTYPGADELCDDIDNDCNGDIDDLRSASLYFDGSNDMVYIENDSIPDITSAITMEAWVYSTNSYLDAPILAKEYSSGQQQYWFGVYYNGFGLLLGNGSGWGLMARSSGYVQEGVWTHLASVWDGTNYYNYQDGVLVESGSYATPITTGDQPLTMGINSSYDNTRYSGNLNDVRLWNVARTEDQIINDMYQISDSTGLVGQWGLDEGSGQMTYDHSGNGLDGRLGDTSDVDDRDPTWSNNVTSCG